jgi:putative hemolysin
MNDLYEIKIADQMSEFLQVLRLRYQVFFEEFATSTPRVFSLPYDIDRFDFHCDHLVVKDRSNGKVVACYRLLCEDSQKTAGSYYTQNEFMFHDVLCLEGKKIEIGRACVHKDFRKGTVIALLWRGLLQYAKAKQARFLFGCSSISGDSFKYLPHIMETLRSSNAFMNDVSVLVRPEYQIENHQFNQSLNFQLSEDEELEAKHLPSLIHMYVLAGAKVAEKPAYDKEMNCLDLFTLIDLKKMPSSFERRFSK